MKVILQLQFTANTRNIKQLNFSLLAATYIEILKIYIPM